MSDTHHSTSGDIQYQIPVKDLVLNQEKVDDVGHYSVG